MAGGGSSRQRRKRSKRGGPGDWSGGGRSGSTEQQRRQRQAGPGLRAAADGKGLIYRVIGKQLNAAMTGTVGSEQLLGSGGSGGCGKAELLYGWQRAGCN